MLLSGFRKMGLEDTGKNAFVLTSFIHNPSISGTVIKMTSIVDK